MSKPDNFQLNIFQLSNTALRRELALSMLALCSLALFSLSSASAAETTPQAVDFNRQIRPILSDKCFQCHGPDTAARQAELRLDDPAQLQADRGGYRVLAPGKPPASELYRRITAADEAERMPPGESDKTLSQQEIELIRRWIQQGGEYPRHWSFIAPRRPPPPSVEHAAWPINPIDRFVLARLQREHLAPSPPADKATLLRRVALDLTGLPPTLQQLEAFLSDDSPAAYDRVVRTLLDSPRYGEQMARYWLDAARYADTNGFFTDDERTMWRWRDWVIEAFNDNMPFDRFTVEQLAGDLLPSATLSQRIASGFNRNHMTTHESGVIDEEYRVEYVVDRLETTATVWLGLTVGCARCHDHKFDPISQREFYRLFAFFNNVPEKGNTGRVGNAAPLLEVPTSQYTSRLRRLEQQAAAADKKFKSMQTELLAAQQQWEQAVVGRLPQPPTEGLVGRYDMRQQGQDASGQGRHGRVIGAVEFSAGLLGTSARFDGDSILEVDCGVDFDRHDPFSYGVWIKPEGGGPACVLSQNDDVSSLRGFDLMVRKGRAVVHLIHKWNTSAIQVTTTTPVRSGEWQHVAVTYDGSGRARGVQIYFDGKCQPTEARYDNLSGSIATDQPLRIGRRSSSAAFSGSIDEICIYDRRLEADEVFHLATSRLIGDILLTPSPQRTQQQRQTLRKYYLRTAAPARFTQADQQAADLRQQVQQLKSSVPTTMVMQEMSTPRTTFVLDRGQYDQRGEEVTAGVPDSLPPLPEGVPANRLGLARWLTDPGHPLTARVTVNRFWQQYFGSGIVKTVEDFGSQGEWPSHADLLDWLAVELIESGWDIKRLQRLIVTSATYRQSSKAAAALRRRDPENRLLARGPRFRLDAEVVRDNALAISGLLVDRVGGPSVKPYQPRGLWQAVSYDGGLTYSADEGEALYRRSLYTYWKRQSPPPAMLTFDAPTRETCTVGRPRTNTPLQALALMNDPTYVEAARVLAQRMMTQTSGEPAARIRFAFRLATARLPRSDEVGVLLDVYRRQLAEYQQNEPSAIALLSVGQSPRDTSLGAARHAAWTTVASMILSMDETVTKN